MADTFMTVLLWVAIVLIAGFVLVGLSSRKIRAWFQQPAEEMLERDRRAWSPGEDERPPHREGES